MSSNSKQLRSAILTQKEIRRYVHQIDATDIGIEGQEKLKQSKVLVVGAGGKGASILGNLASLGIGMIGICDNAPVEEAGLSHQYVYGNNDLGKQKAIITRERLREINPLIDYRLHNVFITEENAENIIVPYNLVISATNSSVVHHIINSAVIKQNKSYIWCVSENNNVFTSVFNYHGGPVFSKLAHKIIQHSVSQRNNSQACHISLNTIAASIVNSETIKVLLGYSTLINGNILQFSMENYETLLIPVSESS